ncbi:Na+/H+ antiporter NhaC family protein [Desmospora profundinema]|uniref:Na+/H+ antiporter NhaC n=1 Tax=Desmospora profundinema TaxID=1571184 RepID=A0ABU1IL85_9BACL|nr:Na+/H+ antiporter NhaC family protein [Desmospora profundinema]MDR6224919.1 Na+/H+ antiporter NhaC [Desmospora profundinema]
MIREAHGFSRERRHVDGSADLAQAEAVSNALSTHFHVSGYVLIPAAVVITLLAMKKPAIPTICFGAVLGCVWAILFQGMNPLDAVHTLYSGFQIESNVDFLDQLLNRGGIAFMLDVIVLILFALGLGGLFEATGVLTVISEAMSKLVTNVGRLTLSTIFAGFLGNFFRGAAYVSLITGSKMTEENYDKMRVNRTVLSRNTEAGGTITTPMVPWSDGGIFMAAVLGVATWEYLPFMWFNFIAIAITIFYGYTGKFIWYTEDRTKPSDKPDQQSAAGKSI